VPRGEIPPFTLALADVEQGLETDALPRVRRGAAAVLHLLCRAYGVPPLAVAVYDRPRPSLRGSRFSGELHGDYTPPGRIRIWARTAKRGQRVAFLTFLDTLLHEFLHHYDLTFLRLPDTVHSENFYKRLGSLRGLVMAGRGPAEPFAPGLSFAPIERALEAARDGEAPRPEEPVSPPATRRRPRPVPEEQPLLPF
jgi:hypothetical protein